MVRVNGVRFRKSQLVGVGDNVEVIAQVRARSIDPNPDLAIEVLYADAAMIVVNKPGQMPCHPLRAGERDTVMNAVVARFPETAAVGDNPREGGLIHRLDNGTSGALLVARTDEAFEVLRRAITSGRIARTYQALVAGNFTSAAELRSPIAHHRTNPEKMALGDSASASRKRAGRAATTIVEPLRRVGPYSLVRVTPRTGSRHQIRLHLANAGLPIVGDTLYGGPEFRDLPGRFWLHLGEIEADSPACGRVKIDAPLPSELKKFLR
jgi:23S rRNA pseudouridine1911/1915/1917 synthase